MVCGRERCRSGFLLSAVIPARAVGDVSSGVRVPARPDDDRGSLQEEFIRDLDRLVCGVEVPNAVLWSSSLKTIDSRLLSETSGHVRTSLFRRALCLPLPSFGRQ
jgi:hypothetical protein